MPQPCSYRMAGRSNVTESSRLSVFTPTSEITGTEPDENESNSKQECEEIFSTECRGKKAKLAISYKYPVKRRWRDNRGKPQFEFYEPVHGSRWLSFKRSTYCSRQISAERHVTLRAKKLQQSENLRQDHVVDDDSHEDESHDDDSQDGSHESVSAEEMDSSIYEIKWRTK